MNSFSALRQKSQETLDNISKELDKLTQPNSNSKDDRFWQPTVDKAGNGTAIIRFLPAIESESMPFVQLFSHAFQGPTGLWYIENCLSTLKKDDPVLEYNNKLWNSTTDEASPERKQVRDQKRKLHYYSNIYVVKDPAKPENDGKVFLYKYGAKIFDMINNAMHPAFEDQKPYNPFDLWEGANFKLRVRKVEGYRNYEKCVFESQSKLLEDDNALEAIWRKAYPLQAFLAPDQFKPYDTLKAHLAKVLGMDASSGPVTKKAEDAFADSAPKFKEASAPKQAATKAPGDDVVEEVDDFFASLNED